MVHLSNSQHFGNIECNHNIMADHDRDSCGLCFDVREACRYKWAIRPTALIADRVLGVLSEIRDMHKFDELYKVELRIWLSEGFHVMVDKLQ